MRSAYDSRSSVMPLGDGPNEHHVSRQGAQLADEKHKLDTSKLTCTHYFPTSLRPGGGECFGGGGGGRRRDDELLHRGKEGKCVASTLLVGRRVTSTHPPPLNEGGGGGGGGVTSTHPTPLNKGVSYINPPSPIK